MSKSIVAEHEITAEPENSEAEQLHTNRNALPPFYRQFSTKLLALTLCLVVILLLSVVLFWQQNQQAQSVIQTQLYPLQQQVKQLESLQQAKFIVDELLRGDSEKNWLKLHTDLIALNRQLLRLSSSNTATYRQWLNQNEMARSAVDRAEKNKSRNQQLKQSTIIQLQLMHFSITSISDKKISHEKLLYQQLQKDKSNDTVTLNRANAYTRAVKQSQNVRQIKTLLTEILVAFEQLTIRTTQGDFDLLRLGVEQLLAQTKLLESDNTKAVVEFVRQIKSFEGIVLSEQMALAKWQGYLRLMQSYNLDLLAQKQQLLALLSQSQTVLTSESEDPISRFLAGYNIPLSSDEVALIILFAIGIVFITFVSLIFKVYQQIKASKEHDLSLVAQSIQGNDACINDANCHETYAIIKQLQTLTKPEHTEQDYQALVSQIEANEQLIKSQKQSLAQLAENSDVQQLEKAEQVAEQFSHELHRYDYLKGEVLPQIVQAQAKDLEKADTQSLNHFYDMLEQFQLASYLQSSEAILSLSNINLLEEIHSTLLSQLQKQSVNNNQLFMSYDEQITPEFSVDVLLIQHLFTLLIELTIQQCHDAIFHLHLQLQDKNSGQQVIRFVTKISAEKLTGLPSDIKELAQKSAEPSGSSPLVEVFKILLVQLHGENLTAQLIDEGYQLSFELPLAIVNAKESRQLSEDAKEVDSLCLAETKVLLLSRNKVMVSLIEKLVLACAGKFEAISRMDSFSQLINAKHLRRHKLDLLIVTSDIATKELGSIEQQISALPDSLRPKLMIMQSAKLSVGKFGLYQQAEQPLCKGEFLHNIVDLLAQGDSNNRLFSADAFQYKQYIPSQLQVLLAVNSPQYYQKLQRLLQWLGLQVHFVSNAVSQAKYWQTGRYCLLITEFPETVWLDMSVSPDLPIGVFSLSSPLTLPENAECADNAAFAKWHCGQLTLASTLTELEACLSPWLKEVVPTSLSNLDKTKVVINDTGEAIDDGDLEAYECEEMLAINEVAECFSTSANSEASFDFNRYLKHQGSVELALFMLEDYSQDNHQQLAFLATAIKGKDIDKAKLAVKNLQLNAKILAAEDLEQLCTTWLVLLSKDDVLSQLTRIKALLKDTQQVLHAVDSYAQTI